MSSPMRQDHSQVTVVGAGVIGLSVACRLAEAGLRVTVVADQRPADTVSAVAGAIWFPHLIDSTEATLGHLGVTRQRFERLSQDPATGVVMRDGTLVERRHDVDRSWTAAIDDYALAPESELPPGATAAVRMRVPVIDMGPYLGWLEQHCRNRGVQFDWAVAGNLDDLIGRTGAVVVAAGLRSPELLRDDDSMFAVRGQVARLHNPGLMDWLIDDEHPDGLLYVLPRNGDIVVGGTSDRDRHDLAWDPDTETAILQRAVAAVPELDGLPVVSRAVGLRPARPTLRIEAVGGWAVPVIACYGHGGAGVSTSWGSADAVTVLVTRALPG
ncbi:MAG: FAD-dependent oxidoreductase [Actinomycetales bacterium]